MPADAVQGEQPVSVSPSTSRVGLLHLLAEAAELEHNRLCSYLFAAFSLRSGKGEGLSDGELDAVCRWHGTLMGVCVEEMVHLAQVGNLMSALGARPHFNRPDLPVAPGYHPSSIVVELAPFSAETLQHFIFLERSDEVRMRDSAEGASDSGGRGGVAGGLMPSAPDYVTIGEFYESLQHALVQGAEGLGAERLFLTGQRPTQLRPEEIHAVMRTPMTAGRLQVTASPAREVLDAFNATYALMWRALTAVWDTPWDRNDVRQALLGGAFGAMHLLGILGDELTRLPASDDRPGVHAGPSFTMPCSPEGWTASAARSLCST